MSTSGVKQLNMLWFTGSSTEGLPFIHDSFRPGPKAVHHTPRKPRQNNKDLESPVNGVDSAPLSTRNSNQRDSVESDDSNNNWPLKLPLVGGAGAQTRGQASARDSTFRPDKDPVSFTSYMRRYKACVRLKGISPTRAFAANRARANSEDDDLHNHHDHNDADTSHASPRRGIINSISTTSVPLSNLNLNHKPDQTSSHRHAKKPGNKSYHSSDQSAGRRHDHRNGHEPEAIKPNHSAATEVTKYNPDVTSDSDVKPEDNAIARQIEEKLLKDSIDDGGLTSPTHPQGFNYSSNSPNGRGRRGRHGSRHAQGGGGGYRPLGGIVSPHRMQELLTTHGEERTLPYTFYRTSVEKENLDVLDTETLSKE